MTEQIHEIAHSPSDVLAAARALEPQIRAAAESMEIERRLPPPLARALMEAGVFRMGVPRVYGGSELDPMAQVRVVEELSRFNGSVGWLSMIGSAGSFLSAFLAPDTARRLFGNFDSVIAGQLRPPHHAEVVDGGFRVSGTWHFGSGSAHASTMVCGCMVFQNGEPKRRPNGQPEYRVMLVPAAKAKIIDVWHTTGMRGTGSNDFTVDNVFVPADESVSMAEPPYCPGPLYLFPPLFLVSHAGVPLGIGRSAIEYLTELGSSKLAQPSGRPLREDSRVQDAIAWAEAALGAARAYVYSIVEELWATLCKGDRPSPRQRATYRLMITYSHQTAKEVVSTLYDIASSSSIFRGSPLDRDLRDIATACQHYVVHLRMYRPAGRLLLGMDSEEFMF
jgi:alkylation response protein AidB-like acyl-CoA dehydrogenase